MKTALSLILCIGVVLVSGNDIRARRYLDINVSDIGDKVSDTFDCRRQTEECRLVPACCGNLQCYWEHGYNPLSPGVCVPCIDRKLKCQRDSQCCEGLVCQKKHAYAVDGVCDIKLAKGSECYKDNQCETHYCDISWYAMIQGRGGNCTDPPRNS